MHRNTYSRTGRRFATLCAAGAMLFSAAAQAGPIFEIVGVNAGVQPISNLILSNPLPGTSGFNTTTGTGGGAIFGTLTLNDGFVLPTLGNTANFGTADILELRYSHILDPVSPIFPTILGAFSFTASQSDLVPAAVSGEIRNGINGLFIVDSSIFIETTVQGKISNTSADVTLDTNPFSGAFGLGGFKLGGGIEAGIRDTTVIPTSTRTGEVYLFRNPQRSGIWRLTGFSNAATGVQEPGALALFAVGLAGLTLTRRRRRAR